MVADMLVAHASASSQISRRSISCSFQTGSRVSITMAPSGLRLVK